MSKTEFPVNHSLTVKVFSKELYGDAIRRTYFGKFRSSGKNSIVQELTELKKGAGDQITFGLRVQGQQDGVVGDATLEGNEESMQFYNDSIVVNQLRFGTAVRGKMTEQRVPYNLRAECKDFLADIWAERLDTVFFNQLCGYTPANTMADGYKYAGHNQVLAPSTNRQIWAGSASNDQGLTSSDTFSLELIDYAKEKAMTANTRDGTGPLIRPIKYMGNDYYVMFLHDYQVTDLRTNTASGQWLDIQKSAMGGGDVKDNPIFNGSLGIYNGVVLHPAARITQGVNSSSGAAVSTVRRAVFCGAQALAYAQGGVNGANGSRMDWNEETFDYGNQFGVAAGMIFGMKKTRFAPETGAANNEDFGSIVVSTYAAAHS